MSPSQIIPGNACCSARNCHWSSCSEAVTRAGTNSRDSIDSYKVNLSPYSYSNVILQKSQSWQTYSLLKNWFSGCSSGLVVPLVAGLQVPHQQVHILTQEPVMLPQNHAPSLSDHCHSCLRTSSTTRTASFLLYLLVNCF